MKDIEKNKLGELILKSLEGTVDKEEFELLKQMIMQDDKVALHYVEFMANYVGLYQPSSACAFLCSSGEETEEKSNFEFMLWQALAEDEKTAEGIPAERLERPREKQKIESVKPVISTRREVSRLPLYTAIISSAALIIVMLYIFLYPGRAEVVATLTDEINAQWSDPTMQFNINRELRVGSFELLKGFVEITFDKGAEVVVQGPAIIDIETDNQLFLHYGKVFSRVPKESTGFTIRTPDATVVDYGTEFGVQVSKDGRTEAHVTVGKVDLRSGSDPRVFEKSMRLTAGQAGMVDHNGDLVAAVVSPKEFVRKLDDVRQGNKLLGRNLVINGDFEADKGVVFDESMGRGPDIKITGWQDETQATVISYKENIRHDYPNPFTDVVPPERGNNFFAGTVEGSISQEIDISELACLVETSRVGYRFSAWLGGYDSHADSAELIAVFLDEKGVELGSAKLAQVTVFERHNKTGFVKREVKSVVPSGAHRIRIELNSYISIGVADAYVDNVELVLIAD